MVAAAQAGRNGNGQSGVYICICILLCMAWGVCSGLTPQASLLRARARMRAPPARAPAWPRRWRHSGWTHLIVVRGSYRCAGGSGPHRRYCGAWWRQLWWRWPHIVAPMFGTGMRSLSSCGISMLPTCKTTIIARMGRSGWSQIQADLSRVESLRYHLHTMLRKPPIQPGGHEEGKVLSTKLGCLHTEAALERMALTWLFERGRAIISRW